MISNRFAVAGLAATIAAFVAGSAAAAPQYMSAVQGTQVGPDVPSSYFDDSNGYQNHPVSSSVAKTNFTVDAVASSANGGSVASSIDLAPLDGYEAPDHALTAISQASIVYTFTITPKNGSADVDPLQFLIEASGSISWNHSGTPTALFRLTNYNTYAPIVDDYVSRNANGANTYIEGSDGFTTDGDYTLYTNTVYSVEISASTYSDARGFETDTYGHVYASVDPTFTLVGGDASQYAFVGAPDGAFVAPPPGGGGVPEPATWALMLLGFGGLGAGLRTRRRTARA